MLTSGSKRIWPRHTETFETNFPEAPKITFAAVCRDQIASAWFALSFQEQARGADDVLRWKPRRPRSNLKERRAPHGFFY